MGVIEFLRRMFSGRATHGMSEQPRFRCLRCGAEFEGQYDTCPECGGRFVAEIDAE